MLSLNFCKLLVQVAPRRDLRATDKLLLAVLADRINGNGSCCPGMRSMAKDAGLRVATVVESLARLEQAGEIVINRQGSGRRNRYCLSCKTVTQTVTANNDIKGRTLGRLLEVVV